MTDVGRAAARRVRPSPPVIAVTGAAGTIGGIVRERLAERYRLRLLTHRPAAFPSVVVDLEDLESLASAFDGVDAVVHLAGAATQDADWSAVLTANIVGTRNVYEAAVRAGVARVIFASSNHVVGEYEVSAAPEIYGEAPDDAITEETPVQADSLYGVSKAFGEVLGRFYVDHHGLSVICLRIGTVRPDDDPRSADIARTAAWLGLSPEGRYRRMQATWLSHRDCAELISAAIETDARWTVAYGVSDNPRRFWSLRAAREVLGFEPLDRAPSATGIQALRGRTDG